MRNEIFRFLGHDLKDELLHFHILTSLSDEWRESLMLYQLYTENEQGRPCQFVDCLFQFLHNLLSLILQFNGPCLRYYPTFWGEVLFGLISLFGYIFLKNIKGFCVIIFWKSYLPFGYNYRKQNLLVRTHKGRSHEPTTKLKYTTPRKLNKCLVITLEPLNSIEQRPKVLEDVTRMIKHW